MATITPVSTSVSRGVIKTTWEEITASTDTVGHETLSRFPNKTAHVRGTFNSGVVTIVGSNGTSTEFVVLHDPQGNNLTFSSEKIETVLENPLLIKATVTGATGGTDVDVILISKKEA